MNKYTEIIKLKEMLQREAIPFDFYELFDGYTIKYPNSEYCKCSVIEHEGSYGRDNDLLEIQGLMTDEEKEREDDDVLGYLTAQNVFERIKKHYQFVIKLGGG